MWLWFACTGGPDSSALDSVSVDTEMVVGDTAADPPPMQRTVTVTLDGVPTAGIVVGQAGTDHRVLTDFNGQAAVMLDWHVEGDTMVVASHPEARIGGVDAEDDPLLIELVRFETTDNQDYVFQDPGTPDRRDNTSLCAHCHASIVEDWYASPHRSAASNLHVQDLYAGVSSQVETAEACADSGGQWWSGLEPGTGLEQERCYLGDGVLPLLNEDCGIDDACDESATVFGDCADCHAPGIDGALGGRNLLDATGVSHDAGVHCDVCHKVESVDLTQPAGVAGRLHIVRPTEPSPSAGLGDWSPLTFGPHDDVLNPRMGSVQRDHYESADFCAGCHQHEQPVLVAGVSIDMERWPDGVLPVHSTYQEWLDGPYADVAPCQSCHMPPDPDAGNGANLESMPDGVVGVSGGWWRDPGEVRRHTWTGPRSELADMLGLAASLTVDVQQQDAALEATVTVKNVGPGHAIPTGEPMRSMLVLVEARCGGVLLESTGGSAVPDFGGYRQRKHSGEDWTLWPGAAVGQRIQVVRYTGDYLDYPGVGPFGDGRFSAAEKGMPEVVVVGGVEITAVNGDVVTLSSALPEGDVAYLIDGPDIPEEGAAATPVAGMPGFGFARVMVGADGARMVPHYRAVDVASDNRLPPQTAWSSTHTFAAICDEPDVRAVLLYRAFPLDVAWQRGWEMTEVVMQEASP